MTPFPYNTDVEGRDLPVEIGRFRVPADRRYPESGRSFELGFVRYPAIEGAIGDPIVFLSAEDRLTTERQRLFLRLTEFGDVIVFNWRGYGFSTPPPACSGQVRYPFDVPLIREHLQSELRRHARECFSFIESSGISISAYQDAKVAGDLYDLVRALGVGKINLVVEGRGAEIAARTLSLYPKLVNRTVLVDPSTGIEAAARLFEQAAISAPVRRLREVLSSAPMYTHASSASGQTVELAIAELDYAFILADAFTSRDWAAVVSASESALAGDPKALAALVLELRRRLGQPSPIAMIDALHVPAAARKDSSDLEFAMAWPASALEGSKSDRSFMDGRIDTPVLVVVGTDNASSAMEIDSVLVDAFPRHHRIQVPERGQDMLGAPGLGDVLARFFRGELIEDSELTSDAQSHEF